MLLPEGYYYIYYEGYEAGPVAWIAGNLEPDHVCLDVGGHIGVYAVLMGMLVGPSGRVHVFEPLPFNVQIARQSVEANGLSGWVSIERVAIVETDGGVVALYTAEQPFYSGASARAEVARLGTLRQRLEVRGTSLDAFVEAVGLSRVDLIKMDIEGGEERALRGAVEIPDRFSPQILLEVHGHVGVGALRFLEQKGYRTSLVSGELVSSEDFPDQVLHVISVPL